MKNTQADEPAVAAQQHERRLRFTLESTGIGLWEVDWASGKAWRTVEHARIFGYENADGPWGIAEFLRHVVEDDRARVEQTIQAGLDAKKGWSFECRIRRRDSEVRWIWVNCTLTLAANGQPERTNGVILDVTERKQDEEMRLLLASIVDISEDAIISKSFDGRILTWNNAAERIFGYRAQEIIGKPITILLPSERLSEEEHILQRLKKGEAVEPFETVRLTKEGLRVDISLTVSPLKDHLGQVVGASKIARDISKAKRAAKALQQSERRFATVFQSSPVPAAISRLSDNRFVDVNPAFVSLYGFSREEILGHTSAELGLWPEPKERDALIELLKKQGEALGFQAKYRTKGGKLGDCLVSATFVEIGDAPHMFGTILDFTERKRAEEEISRQAGLIRTLLDSIPDTVFYKNPQGVYLGGNAAMAKVLGRPLADIVGKTDYELFPRAVADALRADDQRVSVSTAPLHLEEEVVTSDGTKVAYDTVKARWVDKNGEVLGVLGVARDHTEKKRLEAELRESERRFKTLFRSSPMPGVLADLETLSALDVNDAYLTTMGYTREEVIGRPPDFHPILANPEQLQDLMRMLVEKGEVHGHEMKYRKKSGEVGDALVSASVIDIAGSRRLIMTGTDTTERKQLEERLRQAHKMEAMGHLTGGMAHEFNNILAAMMMNLGLARMTAEEAERAEMLASMEEGCNRAAYLIKQLLAFSRQSILRLGLIHLAELVSNYAESLRLQLGGRIELKLALPGDLPWVRADRTLIEQVLLNLCLNARDAMKGCGQLRVEVCREQVEPERAKLQTDARAGAYVCLSVTDTGCGMDEHAMKRLFEPFFTSKGVGQGTGLGLATVRGIVLQHQGWIEAASRVGEGSTFRVYLPVVETAPQPAPSAAKSEKSLPSSGSGTILVVEDDARLRGLTTKMLAQSGYRVLEATDGESAFAVWAAHRAEINLLYTDMVLPGAWTGLQIAQRARADKPDLKVIITSGYNTDVRDIKELAAAAMVYLPKPCPSELLRKTVGEMLSPSAGQAKPGTAAR